MATSLFKPVAATSGEGYQGREFFSYPFIVSVSTALGMTKLIKLSSVRRRTGGTGCVHGAATVTGRHSINTGIQAFLIH